MAKIDTFRQKFNGLINESGLVETLDKSNERDFPRNWSDFVGYLHSEYKNLSPNTVAALPAGDIGAQLTYSKAHLENSKNKTLEYSIKNLEEIVNSTNDKIPLLINVLPVRDEDIRDKKAYDLDRLTQEYEDIANRLKTNLIPLTLNSSDSQKERHNAQKNAIKKYEEFASLLRDNRELVENILGYRELVSHLGGEDRKPDTEKMKDLYFAYLNGILNEFKNDKSKFADNIAVIGTLKYLAAKNSEFLTGQYAERIIEPAQEKLKDLIGTNDIGSYVSRAVGVKNPREQMQFLEKLYSLSESELAKKNKENKLLKKVYGYDLKTAA